MGYRNLGGLPHVREEVFRKVGLYEAEESFAKDQSRIWTTPKNHTVTTTVE